MSDQDQQLTKQEKRELKRQGKEEWRAQQERKKKVRKFLSWSVGIAVIVLAVWGMVYLARNPNPAIPEQVDSLLGVRENDWVVGNSDAPAILIEYSDFQCPACGAHHPLIKQLIGEFGNQVAFVYRHFPLRQIHPNAELAAQAAEAAGQQNKFWEMHDLIFENQRSWSNNRNAKEIFVNYAKDLGLDVEKFKADIESKEVKAKVNDDYRSGIRQRVNATPTFFLNGEKLQNPRSYEEFKRIIENALSQP